MRLKSSFLLFLAVIGLTRNAVAEPWGLPVNLDDRNTSLRFSVDSTWHLVKGRATGVQGRLYLLDPGDPLSVRGEARAPVNGMNTENSRRDRKMLEVMAEGSYPELAFKINSMEGQCRPETTTPAGCNLTVLGDLTIRGKTRPWKILAVIRPSGSSFQVTGAGKLRWPDFGVEDPSIFVAKLDQEVTIDLTIELNNNNLGKDAQH